MRTVQRKSNVRASARAARLEAEKARLEAERIQAYGPLEPTPEPPLDPEPTIVTPEIPVAAAEATPLTVPEGDLATLAHEVNTLYALAERNEQVAQDRRLAMALKLAEIKKLCEAKKLPFKSWAEAHLSQTYQTARKMAQIGASPDPQAALEAIRSRNKEANKALREQKQRAIAGPPAAPSVSRETPVPEARGGHGFVEPNTPDVPPEPLQNDRLINILASIHDMRVPEMQMVAIESLRSLEKEPAIEAIERAGFSVLDTRVSVGG